MKKRFYTIIVIVFYLLSCREAIYAQEDYKLAPTRSLVKRGDSNELIVFFKSKPSAKALLSLSSNDSNIQMKYGLSDSNAIVVEVNSQDKEKTIAQLKMNPNVTAVTNNPSFYALAITNDPGIVAVPTPGKPRLQWNLFNMKFAGEGSSAWDTTTGSANIVVAVIDSGVDSAHDDLVNKFSSLVDCTGSVCQEMSSMTSDPDAASGHGTHVAGLVAAATNNNNGIAGSGYNTKMMIIRVIDVNKDIKFSYIINAIRWAADHGAKVINLSLGAVEENLTAEIINEITQAVNYAWSKGLVIVAAAGNCGANTSGKDACAIVDADDQIIGYSTNSKFYPAACPNVLSVASITYNNQLASYSQHNDPSNPRIGNWISVAASGGDCTGESDRQYCVLSTWPRVNGASDYAYDSGTSMASPQVAGLAGLMFAAKTNSTNLEVKNAIQQSADKSIAANSTNFGAVDALGALTYLSSNPTMTPTTTPGTNPTATPTEIPLTPSPTIPPAATATPTQIPYPTTAPVLPKVIPDPFPAGPYCPMTVTTDNSPGTCKGANSTKTSGDANCDGSFNNKDYLILRNQYDRMPPAQPININANFSCTEGNVPTYFIDLSDFEIWRRHAVFE